MVLEKLGSSLKETLKKIARAIFVDEGLINELVKDIQRALLQADVNVQQVFELTNKIKERALKEKPPAGLLQKEYLIKIVYEELTKFLGEERKEIKINKKQFRIMFCGTFGSGKTTTIGKIANYYSKRGHKVCTLGLDVHRPAAPEQLRQVSERVSVPCFIDKEEKNALRTYKKFESELKKFDIVLIDTAGRAALDKELIDELRLLNEAIKPDENILVVAADIGQAAQKQAEEFHKNCGITSIIVTRMDGTAKAGGALTACTVTNAKIVFIGTGEKMDDLEPFNPQGFVSRLLGMGDLEALLEKAKEAVTEEQARDMGRKFFKGEFNFFDMFEQLEAVRKMGPLSRVAELIPGFGVLKIPKELFDVQGDKLKKWRHIMQSMTKEELENPEIIEGRRIERIAKGSGNSTSEVKELLKSFRMLKKMAKEMSNVTDLEPEKLMKKLKGGKIKFKRM
ncbi:signal recognition particle protein [archaeon]|nr:signal recognition particle protein [archaeon]